MIPEHHHLPAYDEMFELEGAIVLRCAVEGCTAEAEIPIPATLEWRERQL